jgi:hypothetical protein
MNNLNKINENLYNSLSTKHTARSWLRVDRIVRTDTNLDTHMNKVFKFAQTENVSSYANNNTIHARLQVYYKFLAQTDIWPYTIDILFNEKFIRQPLEIRPVIFKHSVLFFLRGNLDKINNLSSTHRFFYIPLSLVSIAHANILIVDRKRRFVYRLEPNGEWMNKTERRQLVASLKSDCKEYGFQYTCTVWKSTSCKRVFSLQRHLGGEFCVLYAMFQMYLLTRMNQNDMGNFLQSSNTLSNVNSYMYKTEYMSDAQQKFVFAHFIEKIFHILQATPFYQEKNVQSHWSMVASPKTNSFDKDVYVDRKKILPFSRRVSATNTRRTSQPNTPPTPSRSLKITLRRKRPLNN